MTSVLKKWGGAAVLAALGLCVLAVGRGRGDDAEEEAKKKKAIEAAPDVAAVVDALDKGMKEEELRKKAEAVAKKQGITPIMWQMKPRDKGGVGVGKPGDFTEDSIELELLALGSKKGIKKDELVAKKDALIKMAQTSIAIAHMTPSFAAEEGRKPAEQKKWNQYAEDQKKASQDLIDAINSGDPKKVNDVANKVNKTCNDCHTDFRDK
jgi:hypothetical protein